MEELSATITDITEKISTTATNVEGINDLIIDTCSMISEENAKMKEMMDAMGQITIGIDHIASVIQANSVTSEESAAASEELSSQAQVLHGLVKQFKLNTNNK